MIKPFSFHKALFASAMLLLCGIFLQSCTEEIPILKPRNGSGTTSNNSNIVVKVNNTAYTLTNKAPGYAIFVPVTTGTGASSSTQYSVNGSNGIQTNVLDFGFSYISNSVNNKYVLKSAQLEINNKTYTTLNSSGTAQLTVDKMDVAALTSSGSFSYYLYDSPYSPTDSIYVSGTFNIVK